MSDTKHAGRYLAEQAGAFDATTQAPQPNPSTPAATATLAECAAAHDGQPVGPWLALFYEQWES